MGGDYNMFFYATICHVCKRFGDGILLKRCGGCKMIAYCSQQHQKQHWPQHKHLCKAIQDVLRNYKMEICNKTLKSWIQIRMNFMVIVSLKLNRPLKDYEMDMFKFPRVCIVCSEQNGQLLEDCQNCISVSFCTKHKNSSNHKNTCNLLKLCFNLDLLSMNVEREPLNFNYLQYVTHRKIFRNINDFIDTFINAENETHQEFENQTQLEMSSVMLKAEHSQYLTRPLTLLYGMHVLDYIPKYENFVIHVIAASNAEIANLLAWEILLHLIPTVTLVNIVMIGPELSFGISQLDICSNCILQRKKLLFQFYDMLYEDYIRTSMFVKPDVVVGFNAGIHECEITSPEQTWVPSVQALAKQNCSIILSCYTGKEAEKETDRINTILNNKIDYIYCGKNPFASLRPHRDYEAEDIIFYQNNFVIVYRNFYT